MLKFTIDGKEMRVIGDNGVNIGTRFGGGSLRQSITNPFLLPSTIGVRYYDHFEKPGQGWRFIERKIETRLAGDLSRHLLRPV